MVCKLTSISPSIVRPRVTPHPDHAAELQRRMEALAYHPQNGFHRDLRQNRYDKPGRLARAIAS